MTALPEAGCRCQMAWERGECDFRAIFPDCLRDRASGQIRETRQTRRNGASGGSEACRCVQTLVRWDCQPVLRNLSVSGRWQTRSHKQSWSENCRAASTACIVCQTRQIQAGRARVCRGICGSSPHGSSLWEGAGDEAHLHTDSLPQPQEAVATLVDGWSRTVSSCKSATLVADLVGRFWRKSHTSPRISPRRHCFSTNARAQPSWVGPRMHCWGGGAVMKRHRWCSCRTKI